MVPLIRGSQRYRLFLRPSDRILDRIIFFDTNSIKTIEIFDIVYICKLKLTEINLNLLQKGMGNGSGSFFFSIIVKRKSCCYSFLLQKSSKTEKISCPISVSEVASILEKQSCSHHLRCDISWRKKRFGHLYGYLPICRGIV